MNGRKRRGEEEKRRRGAERLRRKAFLLLSFSPLLLFFLLSSACSELEKPKTEPFYAQTAPPQKPNELHVPSEQVPHDPPHPSSPHVLFVQLGVQVPV